MWPFDWFRERKRKKEAEKRMALNLLMGDNPCSCGQCSTKTRIVPDRLPRQSTRVVRSGSSYVDDDGIDPIDIMLAAEVAETVAENAAPVLSAIGSGLSSIVESVVEEASSAVSDLFESDDSDD